MGARRHHPLESVPGCCSEKRWDKKKGLALSPKHILFMSIKLQFFFWYPSMMDDGDYPFRQNPSWQVLPCRDSKCHPSSWNEDSFSAVSPACLRNQTCWATGDKNWKLVNFSDFWPWESSWAPAMNTMEMELVLKRLVAMDAPKETCINLDFGFQVLSK